jgi:hypothetical protein
MAQDISWLPHQPGGWQTQDGRFRVHLLGQCWRITVEDRLHGEEFATDLQAKEYVEIGMPRCIEESCYRCAWMQAFRDLPRPTCQHPNATPGWAFCDTQRRHGACGIKGHLFEERALV